MSGAAQSLGLVSTRFVIPGSCSPPRTTVSPMTNKTPEEERIQKEQEARDKEKEREEAAEERRLE